MSSLLLFFLLLGRNVLVNLEQRVEQNKKEPQQAVGKEEYSNGTLYNVWIEKGEKRSITAFINGENVTLETENTLSENIEHVVGDLILKEGKVKKVNIKPEIISGKVLVSSEDTIELEQYGAIPIGKGYKVYRIYDEVVQEVPASVLVGYDTTDFVVAKGKICAALITKPLEVKNIRVLLKSNGYESIYHERVEVTADGDFTISYGNEKKSYKAKEKVTIKPSSKILKESRRLKIETKEKEKRITIVSLTRSSGSPTYRGSIEMEYIKKKGITIINELPLEEYLYAVLGSEMPVSYGLESLKVQAVCARSYAYKQLLSNGCGEFGAHVDDSVSYQVYNNVPENETTIEAVDATKGIVMEEEGEVITAYYFSTSCGYTANASEVWFSEIQPTYLKGKLQTEKGMELDLTKETEFKKFLASEDYKTYDSEYPWYRWKVSISGDDLKTSVDKNLSARYEKNKDYILTLQKNGKYKSKPISSVGTVKQIEVLKRQTGGLVTAIKIVGSKKTIKVLTEYNIRLLLAPLYDKIVRQDQSEVDGLSMLPSGFFVVAAEEKEDKVEFHFTGGGYGHGVGMSQNGVKTMADAGKKYEEILTHYYDGVDFGTIY